MQTTYVDSRGSIGAPMSRTHDPGVCTRLISLIAPSIRRQKQFDRFKQATVLPLTFWPN